MDLFKMKTAHRSIGAALLVLQLTLPVSFSHAAASSSTTPSVVEEPETETPADSASAVSEEADTSDETSPEDSVDGVQSEDGDEEYEEEAASSTGANFEEETDEKSEEESATSSEKTIVLEGEESTSTTESLIEEAASATSTETEVLEPVGTSTGTSTQENLSESTAQSSESEAGMGTSTNDGTSGKDASSTVAIKSGKAVALLNILNVINSNFVNSDGAVFFSNFIEAVKGSIDLRAIYESFLSFGCSLVSCEGEHTQVNIRNDASIENALLIEATTGSNTIERAGSASIDTGNAYAGLNLVNIANTNMIDSKYLLVSINAFSDVDGDVVFPSASHFIGQLAEGTGGNVSVDLSNDAAIENDVAVDTDTGGNVLTDVGTGTIDTGDARSESNVFNEINTSFIGGKSVTILFRVHGDWAGEIFGAPDDLLWMEAPDGSIFLFDGSSGSTSAQSGTVDIEGDNRVRINNKVQVAALTGNNAITGANTALISTGNAYAGANILNVANSNIVGRNWILAIVNIFGDFNGNIAFGRPDLWIGEQISAPESIVDGSELVYTYTIINNGDSPASEVVVRDSSNPYLSIVDSSLPYTRDGSGDLLFEIGTLPAGGATEITYRARIAGAGYGREIANTASVSLHETDNNLEDNTDTAAVFTETRSRGNGIRIELSEKNETGTEATVPVLSVERTTQNVAVSEFYPSTRQSLIIRNTSDVTAEDVTFHDFLLDADRNILQNEMWQLGDVLPHEEIRIGYNITFSREALGGRYVLASVLKGSNIQSRVSENGVLWFAERYEIQEPAPEIAGIKIAYAMEDGVPDAAQKANMEAEGMTLVRASNTKPEAVASVETLQEGEDDETSEGMQRIQGEQTFLQVLFGYIRSLFSSAKSFFARGLEFVSSGFTTAS